MPELPEVEVVRAGLEPVVSGALVARAGVQDERSIRRHRGPQEDFTHRLLDSVLGVPERRGKFLWIPFDESLGSAGPTAAGSRPERSALLVHLGMSGQLLLRPDDQPPTRHTRVTLAIESPGHGRVRIDFDDQRMFGSMAVDELVPAVDAPAQRIPSQVAHIARDVLDPLFDDARFLAALRRKSTTIKRALLDQTLVSGIGNIYADEALWAARIHYDHPTDRLPRARAAELLAELRAVLRKALAEGGTSFDSQYLNVNGQAGYFAHSLNAYGRQGQPCPRCGRPIVRERFMNRGSHLCRWCQRMPRERAA